MKQCSKCNQTKPLTDFPRDPRYRLGFKGQCNACKYLYENKRRQEKVLRDKPICKYEGCNKKSVKHKSFFCSDGHAKKYHSKRVWEKQKADPAYKEYHRKVALNWLRRNRSGLKTNDGPSS